MFTQAKCIPATMPVLHRWESDDDSDDQRPAGAWRYDETPEASEEQSHDVSSTDSMCQSEKTVWLYYVLFYDFMILFELTFSPSESLECIIQRVS